jgi:RND family efflux transporter MFP subunit
MLFWTANPQLLHAQGAGPALVAVQPVVQREVAEGRTFVGTLMPLRQALVGSAVDGRVVEFLVNEGDRVEEGQPLARLLTDSIQLQLQGARAELKLRDEQLRELENGSRPEEIEQAKAKMAGARATRDYLQARRKRSERLFQVGQAVSEEQLQEAISAAVAAEQAFAEATAAHELAVAGPREEQVAQASAQVAMQRAVVGQLEDQLSKHTIISRFAGYVTAEHTEEGQWLTRGDPVAEIVALDQVDVLVHVLEDQIPYVHVGTPGRVDLPALPDRTLTGEVALIVPQGDSRSRTFPVKVRLNNDRREDGEPLLKAGMLARVTLPTGPKQNALMVPKDALILSGSSAMVYVIDPKTIETVADPASGVSFHQAPVQPASVQLGVSDGQGIQVQGNILSGQFVVTKGNERIIPPRPGQTTIVRWPANSPESVAARPAAN